MRLFARSKRRARSGEPAPAPFVVGVPRSGTTLLRLMLDAHPQLAIPSESGIALALESVAGIDESPAALAHALTSLDTWSDVAWSAEDGEQEELLRALFAGVDPWSLGAGVRAVFAAYAARHGKPRWGDKTPVHCLHMTTLQALLPEARFVHIHRDGRDVAVSLRGLSIDPGGVEAVAAMWRDQIEEARRQSAGLRGYREVRYEQLVAEPEPILRDLCDLLELDFDPAMLRPHERAAARHGELMERRQAAGRPMTREVHERWQGHTERPPDPSRAGRWRSELSEEEVARFERVAGPLLEQLGYPLASAG